MACNNYSFASILLCNFQREVFISEIVFLYIKSELVSNWFYSFCRTQIIGRKNSFYFSFSHQVCQLVLGPHHADTDAVLKGTPEEKIAYGTRRMVSAAELAHDLEIPVVTGFTGCEDYSRWFPWPDPHAWERMEPAS